MNNVQARVTRPASLSFSLSNAIALPFIIPTFSLALASLACFYFFHFRFSFFKLSSLGPTKLWPRSPFIHVGLPFQVKASVILMPFYLLCHISHLMPWTFNWKKEERRKHEQLTMTRLCARVCGERGSVWSKQKERQRRRGCDAC